MNRSTYVNPQDEQAFQAIIAKDPECKQCFECGVPSPQWCDVMHGTFICLNCSGQHRGLGVHLSFVRSSTMDGWTNWKPEKLRQMECGGNRRARLYFEANGVPRTPLKARYESLPALRYADMLASEALGKPFNEAAWKPPAWYARLKGVQDTSGSAQTNPNRFAGVGANGQSHEMSSNGRGGSDWYSALYSGWGAVSQKTAELAHHATEAVQSTDVEGMRNTFVQKWAGVSSTVSTYATGLQRCIAEAGSETKSAFDEVHEGISRIVQNALQAPAESEVGIPAENEGRYSHLESDGRHDPQSRVSTSAARVTATTSLYSPVYQGQVVWSSTSHSSPTPKATASFPAGVNSPTGNASSAALSDTRLMPSHPVNPLKGTDGEATSAKPQTRTEDEWDW
ncbi:hypothetical protein JKF63_02484 [Porcisia hertigi]|uniref:Arf-GAP domain-containing protein n=1 Tax=Porcisia hertigi TaxID=2761500 RepID=A0A836IJT8_9TRYP|nr:hypothetical protein JKF63_02484 [Porcisia hertigi]